MLTTTKALLGSLVLSAAAMFPGSSFATTYSSLVTGVDSGPSNSGTLQVIGLGATDGLAYLPVFQDTSGTWHQSGVLPGQSIRFTSLVTGISVGGLGKLQVIGLGASDGHAYVAAYQDTTGNWYPGGTIPGQTRAYSQLMTGKGNSTDPLQLIGLGASDGYAYLVAFQDTGGVWHGSGGLLGTARRYSFLTTGYGNQGRLQVIGKGAADGVLYLAAWQDGNGNWSAAGALPNSSPGFSALQTINGNHGNLNIIGLGASDGELYIPDWQDSSGGYHGAGVLPGQGTRFSQIVAGIGNSTQVQVGGLGASDQLLHMTDYQNSSGTWSTIGAIPTYNVPVAQIVTGTASQGLQIIGLGTNNHVVLLAWQGTNGTWHAGADLTP